MRVPARVCIEHYLYILFVIFRSVFYRFIRTNNHIEGWHRRLNSKARRRSNLELYLLLKLLANEAKIANERLTILRDTAFASCVMSNYQTHPCHVLRMGKAGKGRSRHPESAESTNRRVGYTEWEDVVFLYEVMVCIQ